MLIVTATKRTTQPPRRSASATKPDRVQKVCRTADLEIDWGYAKQVQIVSDDRSSRRNSLGVSERPASIREMA